MSKEVTAEKLVSDLKVVGHDLEEIAKATAGQAGEKLAEARKRAEESLKVVKAKVVELEEGALEKAKEAAKATDHYVRENPWKAVGVAAGLGFLIGLLVNRRQ